jgi:hypothetical protein
MDDFVLDAATFLDVMVDSVEVLTPTVLFIDAVAIVVSMATHAGSTPMLVFFPSSNRKQSCDDLNTQLDLCTFHAPESLANSCSQWWSLTNAWTEEARPSPS